MVVSPLGGTRAAATYATFFTAIGSIGALFGVAVLGLRVLVH
ncbi:MAG TPA: hypothetical protein VGL75_12980 [Acidothermaceae bacterium]